MSQKLSKHHLGLAGEYAVASELSRLGLHPQVTFGNYKRADILLDGDSGMARVQVKSKQSDEWPGIQGVSRPQDFLVLVDLKGKSMGKRPDFFVLGRDDWLDVIETQRKRYPNIRVGEDLTVTHSDGWKGLNLKSPDVAAHREAWSKISDAIGG